LLEAPLQNAFLIWAMPLYCQPLVTRTSSLLLSVFIRSANMIAGINPVLPSDNLLLPLDPFCLEVHCNGSWVERQFPFRTSMWPDQIPEQGWPSRFSSSKSISHRLCLGSFRESGHGRFADCTGVSQVPLADADVI
jgi:hypothetical protein